MGIRDRDKGEGPRSKGEIQRREEGEGAILK